MTNERDEQLGAELQRRAPTPEHRDAFFEQLETRINSAAPKRRVTTYVLPGLAAAAVIVVLAVAIPQVGNERNNVALPPVSTTIGSTPTTTMTTQLPITLASQLGERVERAFADSTGIAASISTSFVDSTTAPSSESFKWSTEGNVYSKDAEGEQAYRADTDTFEQRLANGTFERNSGELSSYGGAAVLPTGYVRLRDTALSLIDSDAAVTETTWNDQPAYEVTVPSNVDGLGARITLARVTVLESSGLPVEVAYLDEAQQPVRTIATISLDSSPTFTAADFSLSPTSSDESTINQGVWRPTSTGEAESRIGYRPLLPQTVPDGFRLTNTYAAVSPFNEFMQEQSSNAFVAVYRQGLLSFTVQTRINPGIDQSGTGTRDPFFNFEGTGQRFDRAITDGRFAGNTAHVVRESIGEPYLWVADGDLILTVSGNLDNDTFLDVVNAIAS